MNPLLNAADITNLIERNGSVKVKTDSITLMRVGLSNRIHIYCGGESLCSIERSLKYNQWGQYKNIRDQVTSDEICRRCWSWCKDAK